MPTKIKKKQRQATLQREWQGKTIDYTLHVLVSFGVAVDNAIVFFNIL
jgi:hypothetical protein